jgi:hypothetical protein
VATHKSPILIKHQIRLTLFTTFDCDQDQVLLLATNEVAQSTALCPARRQYTW